MFLHNRGNLFDKDGVGLVLCLRFAFFERQKKKQHFGAILWQKQGKEGNKKTSKIGRAFSGRTMHFLSNLKQNVA